MERNEKIAATPFGKRTSDLYIDPESAITLRDALLKMNDDTPEFAVLHAVASTRDVLGLYPRKADADLLKGLEEEYDGYFLTDGADSDEYVYFLSDLKTAYLMFSWISEASEDAITEELGIGPGDIRSRVDTMEWILHAMNELSIIFKPECSKRLRPLLTRVRYGIKAELTELVSFKGVGRMRARTLFNAGIRKRTDVADAETDMMASLPRIGIALAKSLKEQAGAFRMRENDDQDQRDGLNNLGSMRDALETKHQSNLFDF
jgi:helicase